jgi:hypothetical protein
MCLDMLLGSSPGAAFTVTPTQSRTQFSLWSVMSAPLLIGASVLHMTPFDLETYSNAEVGPLLCRRTALFALLFVLFYAGCWHAPYTSGPNGVANDSATCRR